MNLDHAQPWPTVKPDRRWLIRLENLWFVRFAYYMLTLFSMQNMSIFYEPVMDVIDLCQVPRSYRLCFFNCPVCLTVCWSVSQRISLLKKCGTNFCQIQHGWTLDKKHSIKFWSLASRSLIGYITCIPNLILASKSIQDTIIKYQ